MRKWWKKVSYLGISDSTPIDERRHFILANKLNFMLLLSSLLMTIATAIFREIYDMEFSIHTKKIIVISFLTIINLVLAYIGKNKIVVIVLIFLPILITISGPILLGHVQEMDVFIAPLSIICLSLIPITLQYPGFKKPLFFLSFIYYLIHVIFLDNALNYFSGNNIVTFEYIPHFQFYFKIIFLTVFLFIYLVLYYYRRQNLNFENNITQINTELINNIEELRATQEQLIQTEKMASLGILTAGIAHEINNPLNFISGAYQGLKLHIDETSCMHNDNVSLLLKNLKTGVDKAAAIVRGLRQFSRDNDAYDEECNIQSIIDNCLTMLNNQLKYRIEVIKDFSSNGSIIMGNVGKLHQVFLNLLTNASDAIPDKGEISIKTLSNGDFYTIEISDNGEGIPKNIIHKITDPFFTTKPPGKGSGLGLSITYRIIKEHKGKIEFESETEKGTLVRVVLPKVKK
jgi:signal transduction histidine kinase